MAVGSITLKLKPARAASRRRSIPSKLPSASAANITIFADSREYNAGDDTGVLGNVSLGSD
jgi:hypothetical protein